MYIIGEASGPERDSHGTEIAPEAIVDFSRQISDRVEAGDPIPYIDSHQKTGLLRELGHVMEGSVTPTFHLRVAVRLDENNPASKFLHEGLKRGKQFGMSIAGDGVDFQIVKSEDGSRAIRFFKVILREISNTTKPSWVPSFGTVLARSVDGELGVNDMPENLENEAAPEEITAPVESEPTTEVAKSEEPVSNDVTETVDTQPERSADDEPATEGEVAVVEQGAEANEIERSRVSKKDAEALLAAYKAMGERLVALGILDEGAPKTEAPENTPVENSEKGDEDFGGVAVSRELAEVIRSVVATEVEKATEPLKRTIAEQAETITELENLPAGKVPPALVREKFDANKPDLTNMTPEERLRFALRNMYEG